MNGVVKINKCSVNKVMRVVHDTKNAYSVCLFTANYTKQAEAFPDNIQKYGTTALFKVSSYHLPTKLLGKISFNLEGHWEKDTHGTKGDEKIFVAEKASESMPETRAEIIKFLMNSSKGVGKVTAETIYNKFGDETLDICAHKPRRLRDIPKMTEQMLGNINAACLSALVRADVQILLGKAELEVSVINQIVEAYGDEATTILKSEPYKLVRLLGFSTTDHIAMSMGEEPDSERRLRAATIEAQKRTCSKTGNMCAEGSAMLLQLKALVPELSDETIADAVAKTASDYDIVRQGRYYYDKVYGRFGITNDNDSIFDLENGGYKKMPLLEDLQKEMQNVPELHRICNILNPLIRGSMACYNRPTNVDLKAKYIVFDFNGMKGPTLTMSMFVVLDFVWTKIKEDRAKRKAVFIDECWKLIGTDSNEMAAEDVVEIFRTIRAYGGSAFAMTQDISQFYEYKGGKYGKAVIGNADTKIIMHLIPSEAKALQAAIQLTDSEMENVSNLGRGQGLVCSGAAKLFVDFIAAPYEKQEITTDAKSFYLQEKALKEKLHKEEQERLAAEKTNSNTDANDDDADLLNVTF